MNKEELKNKIAETKEQMRSLVETAESEKRSLTNDEKEQFNGYQTELESFKTELAKADAEETRSIQAETKETNVEKTEIKPKFNNRSMTIKEQIAEQIQAVANSRSIDEYANVSGNTINLRANEAKAADIAAVQGDERLPIMEPLQNAIIFDKLGIKVINTAKAVKVPSVNNVTCMIEGETTQLTGQKVEFSKATVTPFRVGISMPFSNTAVKEADIDLVDYAINLAGKAEGQLINKLVVSPKAVTNDGITKKGPFVDMLAGDSSALVAATWKNVVALNAKVKGANVAMNETAAYIMSPTTEAFLKADASARKDAGSGRFVIEDGKVDGYPYLVSEECRHYDASGNCDLDYIGFGVFDNLLIQRVGTPDLVVDNLSRSKENVTEINFNDNIAIQNLREKAFACIRVA